VLVVARLTAWKGVDTVIAALGALLEAGQSTVRLVVVGDGPDRARLERLAAALPTGAVRFTGEIAKPEVGRWMAAADGLALCSGYEGLSHVLLEAMAAGLPVVASDVGGNRALIHDGHDGLLVPFRDVPATQRALSEALSDGPRARTIREHARRGAADRTVSRMVEETLAVFREALAEAGSGGPAHRAGLGRRAGGRA
jgi:glycosyltransferase involved in cell wall biosynthesis